jgi:hypothetical protein
LRSCGRRRGGVAVGEQDKRRERARAKMDGWMQGGFVLGMRVLGMRLDLSAGGRARNGHQQRFVWMAGAQQRRCIFMRVRREEEASLYSRTRGMLEGATVNLCQ